MTKKEYQLIVPDPKTQEYYHSLSQALKFVEESRKQDPELGILKDREKALADPSGKLTEQGSGQMVVEEFIIRLLGGAERGLSTFDIYNLIPSGEHQDRLLVQNAIWDLIDAGVILEGKDRLLHLNTSLPRQ